MGSEFCSNFVSRCLLLNCLFFRREANVWGSAFHSCLLASNTLNIVSSSQQKSVNNSAINLAHFSAPLCTGLQYCSTYRNNTPFFFSGTMSLALWMLFLLEFTLFLPPNIRNPAPRGLLFASQIPLLILTISLIIQWIFKDYREFIVQTIHSSLERHLPDGCRNQKLFHIFLYKDQQQGILYYCIN